MEPIDFFYSDGVISVTNGSDVATGQFTAWDPGVLPYDIVFVNDGQNGANVVAAVVSATELKLAKPWAGPTLTGVPYFILRWIKHTDPKVYGVRVSDYLTRLKAIPDNLETVAADIAADRDAVDAAMVTLAQVQADVDADRQAAETAAGNAGGSATAASGSATLAGQYANHPTDSQIPGRAGEYSAKHFASKATAEADRAAGYVPATVSAGIAGLTTSPNATNPTTRIDISAGVARAVDHSIDIVLPTGITKRFDAAWAAGSGNGGLDTGTFSTGTHHVFVIRNPTSGVTDVLLSKSPTNPAMPAGYTKKRRIASVAVTTGPALVPWYQVGDWFELKSLYDLAVINGTVVSPTPTLVALVAPTGIKVKARIRVYTSGATQGNLNIEDPDSGIPPGSTWRNFGFRPSGQVSLQVTECFTDTQARVYVSDSGSGTWYMSSIGWTDNRDEFV